MASSTDHQTEKLQETPLRSTHEASGAKMVPFAGWYMPVQYKGLKEEHLAVRENVGLFDVSHMGEIRVKGPKSLETLQWITTNDVSKLKAGDAQYSLFPNPQGGIVDDLFIYCMKPGEDYLLCVNASNADKDFAYVVANNRGADVKNESSQWSQIAIQGPKAMTLLARVLGESVAEVPRNGHREFKFGASGDQVILARTGYTGEDGAEVFVRNGDAATLWQAFVTKGQDLGVQPIGLGARDTLRTEMKYSLYGNEIDDTTNPYEAGLGWVVKPSAKDFIGKDKIVAGKEKGLKQKLVGLVLEDRGIPRQGFTIHSGPDSFDTNKIGRVTSGTLSPSSGLPIGIAYVDTAYADVGKEVYLDIRGRGAKARVVATPFVQSGLTKQADSAKK
jgi:aminomethyltransferase